MSRYKIALLLIAITIGLYAKADYTVQTYQPIYQQYPQYQQYQPYIPTQATGYSTIQPYNQSYCQNPYQAAYTGQYINPYQYQRPYGYGNNLSSIINPITGYNNTNGTPSIMKNIVRSMIFSGMGGY